MADSEKGTSALPDAPPATPSRIPVPSQPARPFSSFASPTKASLARHNPQLLPRPASAGTGNERPRSRGDIQDVFDRVLGDAPEGARATAESERQAMRVNTQGGNTGMETPSKGTVRSTARSVGGALSAKPRRMSRSPAKRPSEAPKSFEAIEGEEAINPFQKRGLKRSPIPGQTQQDIETRPEDAIPFKKTALRRSPVQSQPVVTVEETRPREQDQYASQSITEPIPSQNYGGFDIDQTQRQDEPTVQEKPGESSEVAETVEAAMSTNPVELFSEALGAIEASQPEHRNEPILPSETVHFFSDAAELIEAGHSEKQKESIIPHNLVSEAADPIMASDQREQELNLSPRPLQRQLFPPAAGPSDSARIEKPAPKPVQRQLFPHSKGKKPALNPWKQPNAEELEEPELPPTPTQLGIPDPIVTTPPAGIHNTPSRRNKLLSKKLKSSPLKPREEAPAAEPVPEKPAKRRKSTRFAIPEDPHAAKKKARDDLLKELQQLQADVKLANKENERIRLFRESKDIVSSGPSNPEELLALLLRSTALRAAEPKPKPISAFKSTSLFLPFAARRKQKSITLPAVEKPHPSHLPTPIDDPLPHLQLFSPLTYTSEITLLPPESSSFSPDTSIQEPEETKFQRHQISAKHSSGLFSARLSMIVDISILSITELNIDKLDPSAESELGEFVRRRASNENILGKDIGVVCWAMGRWVETAVIRARFWCDVHSEFGSKEARETSLRNIRRKKKRRRDEVGKEEEEKRKWTRRDMLPYMGRTSMEILGEEVEVRVEWKLGFDWTGEVESKISASARLPSCCEFPCTLPSDVCVCVDVKKGD